MTTLFKLLFRKTARKLTAEAINVGFRRGYECGKMFERSRQEQRGLILDLNVSREIDQILEKAGF